MKNKTNFSTQRREGAETRSEVVPPRETPAATGRPEEQSTGDNGGNGEKISVSSAASCSTRECNRTERAFRKRLSEKQITQKRHALFEKFADFAMGNLADDPALACKAAETALKALSAGEHDHPGASQTPGDDALKTPALSKFNEDLERAYATE